MAGVCGIAMASPVPPATHARNTHRVSVQCAILLMHIVDAPTATMRRTRPCIDITLNMLHACIGGSRAAVVLAHAPHAAHIFFKALPITSEHGYCTSLCLNFNTTF